MDEQKLRNDLIFLISFLVTSARGCVDEPKSYGPFRLVDAASRLIEIMDKYGISDDSLNEIAGIINKGKFSTMTDDSRFLKMLDEVVVKILNRVDLICNSISFT
ncbi:MAG: DUF6092 family protein [Candidatus Acidifodinimicrobium sp.]